MWERACSTPVIRAIFEAKCSGLLPWFQDMSVAANWVYNWQTLITGLLALLAGTFTLIAARWQISAQNRLHTAEQQNSASAFLDVISEILSCFNVLWEAADIGTDQSDKRSAIRAHNSCINILEEIEKNAPKQLDAASRLTEKMNPIDDFRARILMQSIYRTISLIQAEFAMQKPDDLYHLRIDFDLIRTHLIRLRWDSRQFRESLENIFQGRRENNTVVGRKFSNYLRNYLKHIRAP